MAAVKDATSVASCDVEQRNGAASLGGPLRAALRPRENAREFREVLRMDPNGNRR